MFTAADSLNSRLPPMREHDAAIQDGCMLRVAVLKARPPLADIEVTMWDECAACYVFFFVCGATAVQHTTIVSLRHIFTTPWADGCWY